MLFHELAFLYVFMPVTMAIAIWAGRKDDKSLFIYFLCAASLVFYGWWNPVFVPLLVMSIVSNYFLGNFLVKSRDASRKKAFLFLGVAANLLVLVVFKYLGFFADIIGDAFSAKPVVLQLELPLGISFFTFLQIAYIVDAAKGETVRDKFAPYFLFVTFFPHLIAGPLVHHRSLISQFSQKMTNATENLSVGFTIFVIGLFKKLVLADIVVYWSDAVFNGAANGVAPSLVDSWVGAISFTLLIYFDFSSYSDMAIGLSKMLGIRLPENFNSPYKATSIIEFWRRWHITLSSFLRDYLYIPLGGNRKGQMRRHVNLMIVMLLAGLWHGASWQFVLWGGLHGTYLLINHLWGSQKLIILPKLVGFLITFVAVVFAWIPFRAETWDASVLVLKGMIGLNGIILPVHYEALLPSAAAHALESLGVTFSALTVYGGLTQLISLGMLLVFVWVLPNTQQIMGRYDVVLEKRAKPVPIWMCWKPSIASGCVVAVLGAYLWMLGLQGKAGEFIYFQF
ncbi:MBOAT family O-acyltransferase [Thalassospira lohafexi]|uniref:Probable alginate O-acetylase AlgI n=1 Tax=Thalassospira lohafexi TaxID=744227 RepID=A0A2N3L1Y0_9PROT|nr:MBOAT family O-acyltransferase [Thalassospira lohafexi]PKR56811.1 membrane-bound O-acyltransferase family protein [Thalassospira lohafexi]